MAGVFLDVQPAPWSRIILAFRSVSLIEIAGYVSSTGTKEENQKLGDARAAVTDCLRNVKNVPMWRIVVPAGYGASHPAAENTDAQGRALNRRVDVKVLVNTGFTIARSLLDTFAGIRPVDVPPFVAAQLAEQSQQHFYSVGSLLVCSTPAPSELLFPRNLVPDKPVISVRRSNTQVEPNLH